jgi:hypothetical protein
MLSKAITSPFVRNLAQNRSVWETTTATGPVRVKLVAL